MTGNRLKIALIGCGQIADAHLQEVRKIPSAEAVAVCDRHLDLAEQAALRFGVPGVYNDLGQMLEAVRPDVLHITTPPQTHCALALQAMAAGAHVYIEKPFTVNAMEADTILNAAAAHGRLVCVGHDHLFDPVWLDCRKLYQSGQLGSVVHVDSIQGYDLGGPFGKTLVSEPDHWVHRLPGGLFQNVMSHALYRITDFMPDEEPRLWATWFGSTSAMSSPTELRVMMRGEQMTAHLIFSSTMRPVQRVARIYGTRASVEVDLDGRTLRSYRALRMPGPFAKIEAPFRHWREAARTLRKSLRSFARNEIHYFAGMNRLFTLFYKAIREGGEVPTPPREIRRLTAIMDRIFENCAADSQEPETDIAGRLTPLSRDRRSLIHEGVIS